MGSKSSPPPAPDYRGAAQAQGAANLDAARASGKLSNPSFSNPLGSREVTFGYGGDPDRVFVKDSLTPQGQQRFDQEQRIIGQLGGMAEGGLGRVQEAFAKPFDFSSAADARQQSQDALSGRLEPRLQQDREALRTQLINSGFRPGTEGYDRAMQRADQQATDARLQVINQAGQEQDRAVQLATMLRNQPLNEINALRTGSQVSLPQFQAYSGQNVAAAPIFGATQAQGQYDMNAYNQNVAQQNATMGGLFNLGSAGIGAYGMMNAAPLLAASDRRLKSNIVKVGALSSGLNVYEYDIAGRREIGVMADEVEKVMPEAVFEHPSGYKMVDYSLVARHGVS